MTNPASEQFMRRCMDLAVIGAGSVSPNPMVGAVIVHGDRIIGEGFHARFGGPHAEVNAFASVSESDRKLLRDAVMYVSLEPCCHYGKTPPCTEAILQNGIKKVVIANRDPFPKVDGGGIRQLRNAGVEVITGILEQEGLALNRAYFTHVARKRPYVVLKWAQTLDGFIGNANKRLIISNELTQRLTHQWRSTADAVMVGTNTALIDNPQLNNRRYFGKQPRRVVLDRNLKLLDRMLLFQQDDKTLVVTENAIATAAPDKCDLLQLDFDENLIPNLLRALYERQIAILLVEGGSILLKSFLAAGLWDEMRVFQSNSMQGEGIEAPRWEGTLASVQPVGKNRLYRFFRE